jgi:hypothetical protein
VTVRVSRTLTAGFLAAFALVLAGCGGKGGTSGASTESGASLVRSDALAFVSIDSDLGSSQWQTVDDLSHKFPGRDKALTLIKRELTKRGVDYNTDVKPALGPEVDFAVATGQSLSKTSAVVLTKPKDAAKFMQLIAKRNAKDTSGKPSVYREVNGWYVVSDSQAAIDRVLKNGGSGALSENSTFKDALAKLPGDALAKAYVSGAELAAVIRQAEQQSSTPFNVGATGLDNLDFIAASTSAENDGIRLRGAVQGSGAKTFGSGDYSSTLLGEVPGDALGLLDFRGSGIKDQLDKLKSNSTFNQALQQMQSTLGVTLDDLVGLLQNEIAFYVRPGAGIPEFTLALDTKDQSSSLATLDKLAAKIAALIGGKVSGGAERTITFGSFAIHYGASGGKVVISSGANGISEFGGSGQKLPDSADFREAKAAAGMPDSNGGVLYLDLKNAIPLLEAFAGLAGQNPSAEVTDNLRPLRAFIAWGGGSGDSRTFDAFLEIK